MKQTTVMMMIMILIFTIQCVVAEVDMNLSVSTTGNINADIFLNADDIYLTVNGLEYGQDITQNIYTGKSSDSTLNYITQGMYNGKSKSQAKFNQALSSFIFNNVQPNFNLLYSYSLAQDESFDYMYEKLSRGETDFQDIKCMGRVRYMYKYNISSVECNGFTFINNGEYNRGFGVKITPVEQKPKESEQQKPTIVDQDKLLEQYDRWCQEAKDEGDVTDAIRYCKSECDGGRSNRCVCRDGKTKVLVWLTRSANEKYSSYKCFK